MRYKTIFLTCSALLCCFSAYTETTPPADADAIRSATENAVAILNATPSKSVSLDAFVVKAYRTILNRDPDATEFKTALYLCEENGLQPGELVGLLLRDASGQPSWDSLRTFTQSFLPEKMTPSAEDAAKARELTAAPLSPPKTETDVSTQATTTDTPSVPDEVYNTYFGILHAHTALSDGTGTPQEAYTYARDVAQLDFFSLSDHGEFLLIWPWDNKWQQILDAANAANASGTFVALWGFEWSNPLMGHTNVINSEGFVDTLTHFWPGTLYAWMGAQPQCFGMFNHPQTNQWAGTFVIDSFGGNQNAVNQIVGVELASYYNLNPVFYRILEGRSQNFWDVANGEGWRLGALGNQDNHEANWGNANSIRTGVLAKELTREAIVEAYHQRRFYVTEDKNLQLDFRCGGYPMGARINAAQRTFQVNAQDGNGDTFEEIRLYRNGMLLETKPVTGNPVSATFEDTLSTGNDYYYAVVRQTDDSSGRGRNDEAVSSPIWILPQEDNTNWGCAAFSKKSTSPQTSLADFLIFSILLLPCFRRKMKS